MFSLQLKNLVSAHYKGQMGQLRIAQQTISGRSKMAPFTYQLQPRRPKQTGFHDC
jgi:hypothetical protein